MLPASNLAPTFRFTMRGNRWLTRMTVFRTAITDTLIQRVLNELEDGTWHFRRGHVVPTTRRAIFTYLAHYIYIQGNATKPDTKFHTHRPMRTAIEASRKFLGASVQTMDPPAANCIETFIGRFHLHDDYYEDLSLNMQSIVASVGPHCAADEKLFEFVPNPAME